MFLQSIQGLTRDQKHDLAAAGIDRQMLSSWRTERRLPTEPQLAIYAGVTGIDRHQLQDEIALLRATPEQRNLMERLLGKLASTSAAILGATALIVSMVLGSAQPAHAAGLNDNV